MMRLFNPVYNDHSYEYCCFKQRSKTSWMDYIYIDNVLVLMELILCLQIKYS